MSALRETLRTRRFAVTELRAQRKLLLEQKATLTSTHAASLAEAILLQKCQALCEQLSGSARERVAGVIGPVCTAALQDVFSPAYSMEVTHQQLPSGKYVSRLVAGDGMISGNPMTVRGGSVVNVLSMFLPATFSLLRPDLVAPVFSFDEPLSGVGGLRLRAALEALRQITHDDKHPLQIILTTQIQEGWEDLADSHVHVSRDGAGITATSTNRNLPPPTRHIEDADL
ncbi:MAG: hypothetical protein ACYC63_04980 [Armatimonadota bacterium]